jgi:hypothetical protein
VRIRTGWLLHRHNSGNDTACALSYCHRCRVYRTRLFLLSHTLAPPRTAGPFCVSYAMQKKSPTKRRGKVCSLGGTSQAIRATAACNSLGIYPGSWDSLDEFRAWLDGEH